MSKLTWDQTTERLWEVGVRNCVLYVMKSDGTYDNGVAWNGITSISQNTEGGDPNKIYADDNVYAIIRSAEEFGATIEAYTYPDEFMECDGWKTIGANNGLRIGQQKRKSFGLCYRTTIGNDVDGIDYGYKIHLVYGCTASPSERQYSTINDSPDPIQFSWDVDCLPVKIDNDMGYRDVSHIEIDSTKVTASALKQLEDLVYGTETNEPTLPSPAQVITMFS